MLELIIKAYKAKKAEEKRQVERRERILQCAMKSQNWNKYFHNDNFDKYFSNGIGI